jgi:phage repressor protein C with HTH and peptisase S24 domain
MRTQAKNANFAIPVHCASRNNALMDQIEEQIAWIARGLKPDDKTQAGLARAMGIHASGVTRMLKGERQIKAFELPKIAAYLGEPPPGGEMLPEEVPDEIVPVPELTVEISVGGGALVEREDVRRHWYFARDILRHEIGVEPGAAKIIRVKGDSMTGMIEDRDLVMIDVSDRNPSPPGVFALWDGFGDVVKRVEHIPNSDPPRVVISSVNKDYRTYEMTADEIRIIGRVVWFARRL